MGSVAAAQVDCGDTDTRNFGHWSLERTTGPGHLLITEAIAVDGPLAEVMVENTQTGLSRAFVPYFEIHPTSPRIIVRVVVGNLVSQHDAGSLTIGDRLLTLYAGHRAVGTFVDMTFNESIAVFAELSEITAIVRTETDEEISLTFSIDGFLETVVCNGLDTLY